MIIVACLRVHYAEIPRRVEDEPLLIQKRSSGACDSDDDEDHNICCHSLLRTSLYLGLSTRCIKLKLICDATKIQSVLL